MTVARQPVISAMPEHHRTKPFSHFGYGSAKSPLKLVFKSFEFCNHPLADSLPKINQLPFNGLRANVGKPKKIKYHRLALAPVTVRKTSVHAQCIRPRGATISLARAKCYVLPSEHHNAVSTQKLTCFRGSIPGHVPLPTPLATPYGCTRMTGSQFDSIGLHCMKLSFTTSHRFYRRTKNSRYKYG